jgi:pimeloyl-ACP methyl ester carboxylesterase
VTAPALSAGRLDVAGVSSAVIDTGTPEGAAAPPLLLLHGSGPGVTAMANWRAVIPALGADRRVLAPDQLGFGGTATGEQRTYGRAAWTDHALALLDTLGVGTVDVVGNSMGGAIALSIATARPRAVRRLVLMGSVGVAMALPPGLDAVWGYTPGMEQMRCVIALFAHNRDLVTDELVELRYRASLEPPVRDAWEAMFPPPRQRWLDDLALAGAELGPGPAGARPRRPRGALAELLCPAAGPAPGRTAARPGQLRPLDDDRADGRLPRRRPALPRALIAVGQSLGSRLARNVSGGGVPHRCGGTSHSRATQLSSTWSMSENHSIQEPQGSGL